MKKLADFALHALQWEQSADRFYISILLCNDVQSQALGVGYTRQGVS